MESKYRNRIFDSPVELEKALSKADVSETDVLFLKLSDHSSSYACPYLIDKSSPAIYVGPVHLGSNLTGQSL